ncbi:MAG TPA: adenylate/guanylate cyclase domain-containing protein [Gammaproteobacteria bacterium]
MKLRHSVNNFTSRYQPRLQEAGRHLRSALTNAQSEAAPSLHSVGQLLRNRRLPARVPIALKLAFAFVLLIATGMVVLGFLLGSNQTELLEQQMDTYGSTLVSQMAETAREPLLANDTLNLELLTNSLNQDSNIKGAAVYSDEHAPVVQTGLVPVLQPHNVTRSQFDERISLQTWRNNNAQQPLISYISPIMFQEITVGYALITFDHSVMVLAKKETVATVVSTILLMLLLAITISFYLGQRLTRPIQQLVEASKAFTEGRYDYRLKGERNDELGVLMKSMNFMGEGLLRKEQVEQVFSRYVSPQVASRAIADLEETEGVELGGRHVNASVLFADIVGFTSMSEGMTPQETSSLLNLYFSNIARAVHFCGGHIDKYMGDCAMIVFGVPEEYEEHSFKALSCSWMILELVRQMNQRRAKKGLTPVEFRIGANSGTMLAGNMGSTERMEYTVVGDAVNLASRLSHAGEPGQIIVTEEMLTAKELINRIVTTHRGKIKLRGKREPVSIFHIRDIQDPFRARMLEEIRRIIDKAEQEAA